jgi:hypothetical protein
MHDWYAIVTFGSGNLKIRLPRGPWRGEQNAKDALAAWRVRVGPMAGTIEAARCVRIVGPFCTAYHAKSADISDWSKHTCKHDPLH